MITVPVVRLDELVPSLLPQQSASNATRDIFLLKVDSQGYEVPATRRASLPRGGSVRAPSSRRAIGGRRAAPAGDATSRGRASAVRARAAKMLRTHGFLCFDALEANTHVPEDRPSDFEGFVRAHFSHREGFKCGPGTECFDGQFGVGTWGDLVCVNYARYGLEAAIDRLLCALHCSP